MRFTSILSTVALSGALLATPAVASVPASGPAPDDRSSFPYGPAPIEDALMHAIDGAQQGPSVEGQVAAIDHDTGHLVLDTEDGPISLTADPEQVQDIEVGDIVRVSFDQYDLD